MALLNEAEQIGQTDPIEPIGGQQSINVDDAGMPIAQEGEWDTQRMQEAGVDMSLYPIETSDPNIDAGMTGDPYGGGETMIEQLPDPYATTGQESLPSELQNDPNKPSLNPDDPGGDPPIRPYDPTGDLPTTIPGGSEPDDGDPNDPDRTSPVELPPGWTVDENGNIFDQHGNPMGTDYLDGAGTTIEDLYPEDPGVVGPDSGDVPDPTGADVTDADLDEGNVGVGPDAEADTGILGEGEGIDASTTELTPEQQVDAELARILGEDSPLLAQARAQAAMQMNARGLQNTSMAAGEAQRAMVEAALPMAQQNAQQAAERELANTASEQEAGMFSADQLNDLRALEAQLGTDVSMFNTEQLNEALRLQAELRSAMEQGNAEAMNEAALQLAELVRDAQEQQADLDYQASAEEAAARNAMNETIMNNIAALNEQYLQNLGQADLAIINQTYETLRNQSTVASNLYNAMLDGMAEIMADPKISPSEAAAKIRQMQLTLEASMRMLQELFNTDLGSGSGVGGQTFDDGPDSYEATGAIYRHEDGTYINVDGSPMSQEDFWELYSFGGGMIPGMGGESGGVGVGDALTGPELNEAGLAQNENGEFYDPDSGIVYTLNEETGEWEDEEGNWLSDYGHGPGYGEPTA